MTRTRILLTAAVVAVVAAGVLIWQTRGSSSSDRIITGKVFLVDENAFRSAVTDRQCSGSGGYDDLTVGATVVVRDGQGTVLATGRLSDSRKASNNTCVFEFVVFGVPAADFYSVEVSRRGELLYSEAEMRDQGWDLLLTVGG